MKKFIIIAIPIVTVTIFIMVMLSGNILKKPLGKDDNIPATIDELIGDIQEEKWDEVAKETEDLANIWKRIVFRVQFSSERDEINYFSTNIARLKGAVLAKDKADALMELKEARDHWEELGK